MNNVRAHIGAWGRWLLVVVLLVAKCYVFDVLIAQPSPIAWTLTDYLAKSAAAALLAMPVILTSRRYPVFIVLVLADVWMVVNIIYNRAYHLFITWHLLSIAHNMSGFESSIWPYCSFSLLLFPALTLPALLCFAWKAKRLGLKGVVTALLISVLLSVGGSHSRWKKYRPFLNGEPFTWEWINPCTIPQSLSVHVSESEKQAAKYIYQRSILAYPLFMVYDAIQTHRRLQEPEPLSQEEMQELRKITGPVTSANPVEGNLLIVLLESFESWLLDASDANGEPVCPVLNAYIHTQPLLYVKKVETQISYGMSADGQLIINTGLYPVSEGVTCVDYPYSVYPNLAHFYPQSAVVNPCRNVWNQTIISSAYGYKQLIEPDSDNRFEWNDSVVVDKIMECFSSFQSPACVMAISISGHIPFDSSPDNIPISDTVPELFKHYIQTAHFTDRQMGRLLAWADTALVMQNSVIAITGDHRIFHAWLNEDIREYGLKAHLPFGTNQDGCPLFVVSPKIDSTLVIEHGRQIDIYTTLLDFIGQKTYFWQGMGSDLMEHNNLPDEDTYLRHQLSDKLIRLNYFSTVQE